MTDFFSRYLPEAAHPYYVLKKNGYEVEFASPKGKKFLGKSLLISQEGKLP